MYKNNNDILQATSKQNQQNINMTSSINQYNKLRYYKYQSINCNQSINQSINQYQSTWQSIINVNSINQSINQSGCRSINQSGQSINQSINQSIQSINCHTYLINAAYLKMLTLNHKFNINLPQFDETLNPPIQ